MQQKSNLYLVGPMGAGKTTIGRHLAKAMGYEFFDSDAVIVDNAGADIPWIFDIEGETGFRQREEQVIDQLTLKKGVVLATGGGAILSEDNRKNLRSRGVVVYLQTSIRFQLYRTQKDSNRPLLQQGGRKKVLTDLLALRGPLYEQTADLIVSTDKSSPKNIVQAIITFMETQP
jgi:shikimate kinase